MARDVDGDGAPAEPAALAAAVLTEEAKRQEEQAARSAVTILPDDLLPGVGEEQMRLRETLRAGGAAMVIMLALITVAEQLERAAGRRARARHPGHAPHERHDADRRQRVRRRRARARRDPAGVARRPRLARAHRLDRDDRLGRRDRAQRARRQPVPAVLHARRRRVRPGVLGAGVRVVAHRHVSDPGPRPRLLALLDRATDRPAARAVRRRRDRRRRRAATKAGGGRTSCSRSCRSLLGLISLAVLREPARGRYEQELVLGEVLTPRRDAEGAARSRCRPRTSG